MSSDLHPDPGELVVKTMRGDNSPKYILNIEGNEVPWSEDTITTEEIAQLGGWDAAQGVIEVDKDNNERTLQPGEIIDIKPGQGFGKKHKWKRGLLRLRLQQELEFLKAAYADVQHIEAPGQDWFLIPSYPFPTGWRIGDAQISSNRICFPVGSAYPEGVPYGFLAAQGINYLGKAPANTSDTAERPFGLSWVQFSWAPDSPWQPSSDVRKGSNLLAWTRSFAVRLKEGI